MDVKKIAGISLAFGICDLLTGIFLIFDPEFTLKMMLIKDLPGQLVFLKYIGSFVLCTGAYYFLPFFYWSNPGNFKIFTKHVWICTSLARLIIACFVITQIVLGALSLDWISVPISDLSIAVIQIYYLRIRAL